MLATLLAALAVASCGVADDPSVSRSSAGPPAATPEAAPTGAAATDGTTPDTDGARERVTREQRTGPGPTSDGTRSHDTTSTAPAAPEPGSLPADPQRLGRILTTAERLIRDPDLPGGALAGWAHAQQAAYRLLSRRPALHQPVRRRLPAALRRPYDLNLRATAELRRLTEPREELPNWRIVAPPPADVLRDAYRSAGSPVGIDWTYLAAIHLVETRMGRIRGTSTAGARGPMQFLPSTWEAYGEGDIEDPHDAIRAAARYLSAHGAPGDMEGALYAYNHSQRYVRAISDHAAVMRADPVTYRAYHQWQVYYRLGSGEVLLEEGWTRR